MSEQLSPSRAATFLTCPRQFEFQYVHSLQTDQITEYERYLRRGKVLDTTLQETAESVAVETEPETVRAIAEAEFEDQWQQRTRADTYPSRASYEQDRRISKAAIEGYLEPGSDGIEHLRRSVGTEVHLEWTDPDLGPLHGYADLIVETRDGLLIIDYRASFSGRRFPNKNGSDLQRQVEGAGHYPSRLGKWLQVSMYCQGLRHHELYSRGDEIQFLFYGLIDSTERTPTKEGYSISVDGKAWDMTTLYREREDQLRTLLHRGIEGIRAYSFDLAEEPWELIRENACESCDFNAACGDYLSEEVRFA